MNSLKIAAFLMSLLGLLNSARASETTGNEQNERLRRQVANQFSLSAEEAKLVQNTTVRFYYQLDSSGKVKEVKALTGDKRTQSILEKHFRELQLPYSPGVLAGRVDIRFRVD